MVSPQAIEASQAFLGNSPERRDPLELLLAENTRALEAAILHRLAEASGFSDEEFLAKYSAQNEAPDALH